MIGEGFDAVMASAKAGDEGALGAIYRDLAPAVLGYLRGQGAREPEDLSSEVFVGMVRDLARFQGDERAFRSWVFTITHRRLVDERRRLGRRREVPLDPWDLRALVRAPTGDVEVEALDRLGVRWVADALRRLTPDQRTVLLLRVVADLPLEDVSRITGKRIGAVKTLQRRALIRLAKAVSREGVS